jgi:hypothetical protein
MKCSICAGKIDKHINQNGEVYWDKGHNAEPINDGRCCDKCNTQVVVAKRIENYFNKPKKG